MTMHINERTKNNYAEFFKMDLLLCVIYKEKCMTEL